MCIRDSQSGGSEVQLGILRELSRATGVNGMVGGQYLDLTDAGSGDEEALRRVHALKTGRLMACAVHCALVYAPPAPDVELAYRSFARELGLLFQIVDDILDVAGDEHELGKSVGADERMGKVTYVSLHGLERARELAGETHERARRHLESFPGEGGELEALTDLVFARHS